MKRGMSAIAAAALLSACSSSFTAVEAVGDDADIRIVVAFGADGGVLRTLVGAEPFRHDLEPTFNAGATVDLWIFPYPVDALVEAFPALAGMTADQVADALDARLDGDGGGFEPPAARRVLNASIGANTSSSVVYSTVTWADWLGFTQGGAHPRFRFHLPADVGCPDAARAFRVFDPDDPAAVCPGRRADDCSWVLDPRCDGARLQSICSTAATATLVERPDGRLQLGDELCSTAPVEAGVFGISKMWRCAAGVCGATARLLAIQNDQTVAVTGGREPWGPVLDATNNVALGGSSELAFGGQFAPVPNGAIYAYPSGDQIRFQRLQMTRIGPNARDQSDDGRLEIGNGRRLELARDDIGALRRVTATADNAFLVVDGDAGAVVLERDTRATATLFDYFDPAGRRIDHSRPLDSQQLVGEIVASRQPSRTKLYAVVPGGVAIIDTGDLSRIEQTTAGGPDFAVADEHRITVVEGDGQEYAVVCPAQRGTPPTRMCEGRTLHLFDASAGYLGPRQVPGDVLAVIDGLQVIYRPDPDGFELALCSIRNTDCGAPTKRYLVPPISLEPELRVAVQRDAFAQIGGQDVLGISYGQHIGLLDLASGYSLAVRPTADSGRRARSAPVVFGNRLDNQAWLLGSDPDEMQKFDRIGVPLLRTE